MFLLISMNVYNTVCGGRSYPASTSTFLSTAADTIQVITNPVFEARYIVYLLKSICYLLWYDCLICIFTEPLNESSMFNDLYLSLKSNGQF